VREHFKHGRESQDILWWRFRFPTAKFLASTKGNSEDEEREEEHSRGGHIADVPPWQVRLEPMNEPIISMDSGHEVEEALEELPTPGKEHSRVDFGSRTDTGDRENASQRLKMGIVSEESPTKNISSSRWTTEPQSPSETFLEDLFVSGCVSDTLSLSNSEISSIRHRNTYSSPPTAPPSSLTLLSTNTTSFGKRHNDGGTEDENNRRSRKHPRFSKSNDGDGQSQTMQSGRRLCCPLHAFDPEKYSKNSQTGKKYEVCNGPGWFNMHHLK
jgi:hypothetical protein